LNAYPYDPEKAKQLLQEAGWDPNWVVEVLYYPGNKLRGDFAEIFQQYMADVGVKVDLLSIDVARAIDRLNAGDFEILLSGAGAKPDPSSQAPYFACDSVPENGGWNYGRYCNPEVDAAFERGTQVFTLEERAPIYQEAAKILNDDVPWLYIAIPNYISATSTRITGMHYNPNLTEGRYFDIEQWMLAQ
jgi:peptide/nickel transport system substrate-binding protein